MTGFSYNVLPFLVLFAFCALLAWAAIWARQS